MVFLLWCERGETWEIRTEYGHGGATTLEGRLGYYLRIAGLKRA